MDILELDDAMAAPFWLRKLKINFGVGALRRFDFFHPLDLFELGLRLAGLGVFCAKPIDELHQPPDFPFLVLERGEQLLLRVLSLRDIILIVAVLSPKLAR